MRDTFFEEVEIADVEGYVKNKFAGKQVTYEKTVLDDGSVVFDIQTNGIKQKMTFTPI